MVRENQQSSAHNFVKDFSSISSEFRSRHPLKKGTAAEIPLEYGKAEIQSPCHPRFHPCCDLKISRIKNCRTRWLNSDKELIQKPLASRFGCAKEHPPAQDWQVLFCYSAFVKLEVSAQAVGPVILIVLVIEIIRIVVIIVLIVIIMGIGKVIHIICIVVMLIIVLAIVLVVIVIAHRNGNDGFLVVAVISLSSRSSRSSTSSLPSFRSSESSISF